MVELGTRCTTERVQIGNSPPTVVRAAFLSRQVVGISDGDTMSKPRHQFVYISADSGRLYRSDISPEISTQRFTCVQSMFCLCTAYLLVERRFLRHSQLHSAYM